MRHWIWAGLLAAGLPVAGAAQDITIGEAEFVNSCAQCHGTSATGDGVMAGYLNTRASDLTTLQKNNGGVFPVAAVYAMIDGSATSGIHGTREMPAWGLRYSRQASEMLGWNYTAADEAAFVRGRILALIEYIASIQAD